MLVGGGWLFAAALAAQPAAAADLPLKAPAAAPVPYWWTSGFVEVGGRDFLNDPMRNGSAYLGQKSLAKYYEYSDIRPGAFANLALHAGTSDGLYQIDFGGANVGYRDQSYFLGFSKAGQQYLDLVWDQTPHLYSTSAYTPFLGVGTNALTLPTGCGRTGQTAANLIATCLNGPFDVGIQRDTAAVQYRWTPTDSWDIKADYSNMHRSGTQVDGVVGISAAASFPYGPNQVAKPVDDTTQNFGVNGEYRGTSFWNQMYTVKVGYQGSVYTDGISSYTIQNPYCTGNTCSAAIESPFARLSTWPDNAMNAVNGTLAADLPLNSRYVGTVSYNMMTQNDAFLPITNNPNASAAVAGILPTLNGVKQGSLNGQIDTLLSNNVVTTNITPDLTSKASYRYYQFDNGTPELLLGTPGTLAAPGPATAWPAYDSSVATHNAISSLSMGYIKQNAGEELTWRPTRDWHIGAAYGYERYDYTRVDAASTDENTARAFADWKPASWVTFRTSGSYSDRKANDYDYTNNVARYQFPDSTSWRYAQSYMQFFIGDRTRTKANAAIDVVVLPGLTITPTFKYQNDDYGLNPTLNQGLTYSTSQGAGVDLTYVVNPDVAFTFGYLREYYNQLLYGPTLGLGNQTLDRSTVDTFTAAARFAAIPNKLDFDVRYTASLASDVQKLTTTTSNPGFPDVTTWFQRAEASATYTFDQDYTRSIGLTGKVKARLRYVWERNSVDNWANDPLAPYSPVVSTVGIWLASDNPNYNVHLITGSLSYAW